MISLDRVLIVLVLGVVLQAILQFRSNSVAVWRSNLQAELVLAETLLQQRPEHEAGSLASAAFQALEDRKALVEGQIAEYDKMPWFQQALYDTGSFQAHADWLRSWRQEWSEKLPGGPSKSPPSAAAPEGRLAALGDEGPGAAGAGGRRPGRLQLAVEHAQEALLSGTRGWNAAGMDTVLEEVVNLIDSEQDNVLILSTSCESLRHMAVDDESRWNVGTSLPAILRGMAVNENSSDVQGHCSGLLVHLAASAATRQAIIHQEGVEAVLRAMKVHRSSSFVHMKACAALANLGTTTLEQKLLMAKGAGEEVLRSIKTHLHDVSVLEHCLGALHNLATCSHNQVSLRHLGALRALRDAVRLYPNSEVHRVGTKTIRLLKPVRHRLNRGETGFKAAIVSDDGSGAELLRDA